MMDGKKNDYLHTRFIGAYPVHMNRESLEKIIDKHYNYLVCEKSDGVRFLLLIYDNGICFLHGRSTQS